MGKVKTTWLAPGHSGSPCHHDSIYTKTDLRTGQVYSVKLCNPSDKVTADMAAQRTKFGAITSALSAWIKANKDDSAADHAIYLKVVTAFERQHKCSTLRGYMVSRNFAEVQTDGSVKITIGTYSVVLDSMGEQVDDDETGGGSGNQGNNPSGNNPSGDNQGDNPGGNEGGGDGDDDEGGDEPML